ncbi:MAG: translation initiation factor [Planctomycetota bacterium]|nr:MAG: translation initiation factor [Planctomycetota bacterium]
MEARVRTARSPPPRRRRGARGLPTLAPIRAGSSPTGPSCYTPRVAKRSRRKADPRRVTRGKGWEFVPAQRGGAPRERTASKPPAEQRIVVSVERRKDKLVTVARGFELVEKDLKALAGKLKARLASGGTAREDRIEVQGQHRDAVRAFLEGSGYRVRTR